MNKLIVFYLFLIHSIWVLYACTIIKGSATQWRTSQTCAGRLKTAKSKHAGIFRRVDLFSVSSNMRWTCAKWGVGVFSATANADYDAHWRVAKSRYVSRMYLDRAPGIRARK